MDDSHADEEAGRRRLVREVEQERRGDEERGDDHIEDNVEGDGDHSREAGTGLRRRRHQDQGDAADDPNRDGRRRVEAEDERRGDQPQPTGDLADLLSYFKSPTCCFEGDEPPANPSYRGATAADAVSAAPRPSLSGGARGTVRTAKGEPLEGIMVQLVSTKTAIRTTVSTNAEGRYEFPVLEPGDYTLRIARPLEFLPYVRQSVRVGRATQLDEIVLQRVTDKDYELLRRLVDVRESCPEVGWGELDIIETDHSCVFAHRTEADGNTTIILHNLGDQPCCARVALKDEEIGCLTDLFGNKVYEANSGEAQVFALDGYGYRWFRRDGLRR